MFKTEMSQYIFEHEQTANDLPIVSVVFNFCGRRLLYAHSYLFNNITTECIYILLLVKTIRG